MTKKRKFRAWNCFLRTYIFEEDMSTFEFYETINHWENADHSVVLEQQLNLKDINGKLLYEGDRISARLYSLEKVIGEVKFFTTSFKLQPDENSATRSPQALLDLKCFEILGHIHESK